GILNSSLGKGLRPTAFSGNYVICNAGHGRLTQRTRRSRERRAPARGEETSGEAGLRPAVEVRRDLGTRVALNRTRFVFPNLSSPPAARSAAHLTSRPRGPLNVPLLRDRLFCELSVRSAMSAPSALFVAVTE